MGQQKIFSSADELEQLLQMGLEAGLKGHELRMIRERVGIPLQEIANKTRINITLKWDTKEALKYMARRDQMPLADYLWRSSHRLALDHRAPQDQK